MEDGDSDTDKYPHRTGNNAGHDFVHGTWTVQFLRKPLPNPSPKKGGAFGSSACTQKKRTGILHAPLSFFYTKYIYENYI